MSNIYGKSPLKLICPNCGEQGEHRVIATNPHIYIWPEPDSKPLSNTIGQSMTFRLRRKLCNKCENEFETIETPRIFIQTIMEQYEKLEESNAIFTKYVTKIGEELILKAKDKNG